jgi:hypothetical protein
VAARGHDANTPNRSQQNYHAPTAGYGAALTAAKATIQAARSRATLAPNSELIAL